MEKSKHMFLCNVFLADVDVHDLAASHLKREVYATHSRAPLRFCGARA